MGLGAASRVGPTSGPQAFRPAASAVVVVGLGVGAFFARLNSKLPGPKTPPAKDYGPKELARLANQPSAAQPNSWLLGGASTPPTGPNGRSPQNGLGRARLVPPEALESIILAQPLARAARSAH